MDKFFLKHYVHFNVYYLNHFNHDDNFNFYLDYYDHKYQHLYFYFDFNYFYYNLNLDKYQFFDKYFYFIYDNGAVV